MARAAAVPMVPLNTGIGLRQPHGAALFAAPPPLAFVEVHAENYFAAGGAAAALLQAARCHWPVSLHGVGLALGSAAGIDADHLDHLAALVQRIAPVRISDHACFARAPRRDGGPVVHGNDLLPIAYTPASLDILVANVQRVQDRLQRPILVENLSAYLHWADDVLAEPEFFNALTRRSGCGLLLDVNNLVVNALNLSALNLSALNRSALNLRPLDPMKPGAPTPQRDETAAVAAACAWIDAIVPHSVGEIHLAGYHDSGDLVIDDHGSRVHAPVWRVFRHAAQRLGPRPTLIEWDTGLPALAVLLDEAALADAVWADAASADAVQADAVQAQAASADAVSAQAASADAVLAQAASADAVSAQAASADAACAAGHGTGFPAGRSA